MPYAGLPSQLEAPVLMPKKLKIKFGGALFVKNGAGFHASNVAIVSALACRPHPLFIPVIPPSRFESSCFTLFISAGTKSPAPSAQPTQIAAPPEDEDYITRLGKAWLALPALTPPSTRWSFMQVLRCCTYCWYGGCRVPGAQALPQRAAAGKAARSVCRVRKPPGSRSLQGDQGRGGSGRLCSLVGSRQSGSLEPG